NLGVSIRSNVQVDIHPEVVDSQFFHRRLLDFITDRIMHIYNIDEGFLKLPVGRHQRNVNPRVRCGGGTGIQFKVVGRSKDFEIPRDEARSIKQFVVLQGRIEYLKVVQFGIDIQDEIFEIVMGDAPLESSVMFLNISQGEILEADGIGS